MKIPAKRIFQTTIGFAALGFAIWIAYKFLYFLWSSFSQINPTLGTGIVAAAATIIVSVISVLVSKRLEFRATLEKEHREKKIPFYEEMVKFIFRIAFSGKLGLKPVTEEEMIQKMVGFTENLVIWGSDDVIEAWFNFRNRSTEGSHSGLGIMFEIEKLLLAIRSDLGHKNKNLTKGKILGLFVNDIHNHIEK